MSITFVQGVSAQAFATSVTTAGITTTSGNAVIVALTQSSGTDATTPLTDSKSNTWTQIGKVTSNTVSAQLWYCANISGGASHTFTYTLTTSQFPTICVGEFSGIATTSPLDQGSNSTFTSNNANVTTLTSPQITTTTAAELLVAVGGHGGGTNNTESFANGGSSSATWNVATKQDATAKMDGALGYAIVSSTGTYSDTYTLTSGGTINNVVTGIASLLSSGGGGIPNAQFVYLTAVRRAANW